MGHLLFIDSPLNAGFSRYGNRHGDQQVSSTSQATDHLLNFLYNFYIEFPHLKKCPVYLTGESFAGHYIPNLANKILNNQLYQLGIKLVGIAIGDGWVDPLNQVNYYDSYLYSTGIVSAKFRDTLTWYQTHSMVNILKNSYKNATNYFDFISNNKTTCEQYLGNISTYNFRNYDGVDRSFADFLTAHKNDLGADVDYLSGNDKIYTAFV